jgi:hypothetical protein
MSYRHCKLAGPAASAAPRGGKAQRQDAAGCCAASVFYKISCPKRVAVPLKKTLCPLINKLQNDNNKFCTHQCVLDVRYEVSGSGSPSC